MSHPNDKRSEPEDDNTPEPEDKAPDPEAKASTSEDKTPEETSDRTVFSEHAEPDRPGGYHGVRQPMEPEAAVGPPAGEPHSDAVLTRSVVKALAADGRLADQIIDTRVSGAVVEMSGTVALEFQRTLATSIAQSVPGVLSVQNRLAVAEL